MNELKVGDTIKCKDKDDCINVMMDIAKAGIQTDFQYEVDGEKGFYLEVTKIEQSRRNV